MSLFNTWQMNSNKQEDPCGYSISICPKDDQRIITCYLDGKVLNERVYETKDYKREKIHFKIDANNLDTKFHFAGHCIFTIPGTLEGHRFNEGKLMFVGTNRWISNVLA